MKPFSIPVLTVFVMGTSCRTAAPASPAPATGPIVHTVAIATASPSGQREVFVPAGESFSLQRGEAALRAFVPEVSADEAGGECALNRTTGSGATIVTASYPSRRTSSLQITLTFDSVGHVVRYSERRGVPHPKPPAGATRAQLDSTLRQADVSIRSTWIGLDYPIDQAIVMNRGGGKPTDGVVATIREAERAENLGPITARLERMRKLCGV